MLDWTGTLNKWGTLLARDIHRILSYIHLWRGERLSRIGLMIPPPTNLIKIRRKAIIQSNKQKYHEHMAERRHREYKRRNGR